MTLVSENISKNSDIAFHNKPSTISIDPFAKRKHDILQRIKKHYSIKLNREVDDKEAEEIAENLLKFAKVFC